MVSQPRLNTFQPVNLHAGSNQQPSRAAGNGGQFYDPRHHSGPNTPARLAVESERRLETLQGSPAPRQSISSHAPATQYSPQPLSLVNQPQPRLAPNTTPSRNAATGSKTSIRIFEDEAGAFSRQMGLGIGVQTPTSNPLRRSENVVSSADLGARHALQARQPQPVAQKQAFAAPTPPKSPLPETALTPTSRNPPNSIDFRSNDLPPYPADGSNARQNVHLPATPAPLPDDSTAQITKLENELAQLRLQIKSKDTELKELANLKAAQGRGGPRDILSQCIELAMDIKDKESDLKDLRLNYNLLKEETEKQRRDLAQFEEGDELERAPRTKSDLIAQNAKLKERLNNMTKEFEKRVYDKTLEIERRARAKMHKIAMGIALQHLTEKDSEHDRLISDIQKLEKENEILEQGYAAAEMSYVHDASEIN